MRTISLWITGLLLFICASCAYSQSLADLAKKEKERRAALQAAAKVITNEKASQALGTVSTTPPPAADPEKAAAEGEKKVVVEPGAPKAVKPETDEPVDFQGRPESYWRQTFADARKRVKDLENESNVIILKLNDLQNRFYRENDGYKQQEIQREIQKTIYEQDVNKENVAQARADVVDLEQEARKSGALPGWLRDKEK
jgi:DNA-directed RNA polymerase subunit M/transcription elongation factor TFIIS